MYRFVFQILTKKAFKSSDLMLHSLLLALFLVSTSFSGEISDFLAAKCSPLFTSWSRAAQSGAIVFDLVHQSLRLLQGKKEKKNNAVVLYFVR